MLFSLDKLICAMHASSMFSCAPHSNGPCSKALQHDEHSAKALFWRSEAHYLVQGGTSDGLEAAIRDLKEAQRLEPGNMRVRAALATRQAELLKQNRWTHDVLCRF